ncbi:hypothetical protein D3C73_1566590 [compost metagenome]
MTCQPLGLAPKQRSDARRTGDEVAHQRETLHRHGHTPLDADFTQVLGVEREVLAIGELAHDMRGCTELSQAKARLVSHFMRANNAAQLILEQH